MACASRSVLGASSGGRCPSVYLRFGCVVPKVAWGDLPSPRLPEDYWRLWPSATGLYMPGGSGFLRLCQWPLLFLAPYVLTALFLPRLMWDQAQGHVLGGSGVVPPVYS